MKTKISSNWQIAAIDLHSLTTETLKFLSKTDFWVQYIFSSPNKFHTCFQAKSKTDHMEMIALGSDVYIGGCSGIMAEIW